MNTQDRPAPGDWLRSAEHRALAAAGLLLLLVLVGGFAFLSPDAPRAIGEAATRPGAAPAPPPVEPVVLKEVAPETAREINAAIPFASVPNPPAPPFRLDPASPGFARALDCLAAAGWYEAGDDAEGQRSVVQVVLNRVRHPAFPKSVCGVVFQGSERSTGCQFTFTCDGALRRVPSAAAWGRARDVARQALTGSVYRKVGVATHYHTDWVVPYWSESLLKLTAVRTHLFFRWPGSWGSRAALTGRHIGAEPGIGKLAFLSPVHAAGSDGNALALDAVPAGPDAPFALARSGFRQILFQSDTAFLVVLKPGISADSLPDSARWLCGTRDECSVRAWKDAASAPVQLPVSEAARTAMAFSYRRDRAQGFDKPLWNCGEYRRANLRECMKQAVSIERIAAAAALTRPAAPVVADAAPALAPHPGGDAPPPAIAEANAGRRRPGS